MKNWLKFFVSLRSKILLKKGHNFNSLTRKNYVVYFAK